MQIHSLFRTLGLALVLGLTAISPMSALAGDGHDHGEAPAAAAGAAMPRFAATSDLFELVGVLDGQKLALYLDHAGDNTPVKDAQLELEVSDVRVPLTRVADGEYQALLASPLAEGVTPVTATVVAGKDTDLLAGEIDVHAAALAHAEPSVWASRTTLIAAAVVVLLLALSVWAARRGRAARPVRLGGAA